MYDPKKEALRRLKALRNLLRYYEQKNEPDEQKLQEISDEIAEIEEALFVENL